MAAFGRRQSGRPYTSRRPVRAVAAAMLVAAVGLALLGSGGAATYVLSAEAESGVRDGNAVLTQTAGTSGSAIRFGGEAAGTSVMTYGALCDGTTDDTAAIQRAFDATADGKTVQVPSGKVCRHHDLLHLNNAGMRLSGPGKLLATNPQRSSLMVKAARVTISGDLILAATATQRLGSLEHHKLVVDKAAGTVIRNITVDGSAAAGIFMFGASGYLIEDVTVMNTMADAIHNTFGSHDGTINRPVIRNCGDDGVAIVSYAADPGITRNIAVNTPKMYGQTHGRAYTVVGGDNVTFRDVYAEDSDSAGIYVGAEGDPYYTNAATNVRFLGGTLVRSNKNTSVDHGAVLIVTYNPHPDRVSHDILIKDVVVKDTRSTASRQLGILAYDGADYLKRVQLENITVIGGGAGLKAVLGIAADSYNLLNIDYNGQEQHEHLGFTPKL